MVRGAYIALHWAEEEVASSMLIQQRPPWNAGWLWRPPQIGYMLLCRGICCATCYTETSPNWLTGLITGMAQAAGQPGRLISMRQESEIAVNSRQVAWSLDGDHASGRRLEMLQFFLEKWKWKAEIKIDLQTVITVPRVCLALGNFSYLSWALI